MTVGKAGFDTSVSVRHTSLQKDKVVLAPMAAERFNGINDPNADITTRNLVTSPAPNCIPFMQIERTNEILIVFARNAFYDY